MMEERIDILNPDGTSAGYACGRTEVHSKGLWHRTVHIWAFDEAGNILFQQRSFQKENHPGLLDTSCAGHISAGDSSRESAVRELSEELGVHKSESDLEYLFESSHNSVMNGGTYLDREYYDVYKIVLSAKEIASLVPQPGEVETFVWFTLDELRKELSEHPEKFVEHPKDFVYLLNISNM